MATGVPRTFFRGDTWVFQTQVFQAPPNQGVPANITGWSAWFTAKYNFTDPDTLAAVQVSTPANITFPYPTQGILQVSVPAQLTTGFADGDVNLDYDVQVEDLSANIWTVETGTIAVSADVTRATSNAALAPPAPFPALAEQGFTIPNLPTFASLLSSAMPPGTLVYAQDAKSYYLLDPTSGLAPDGTGVVKATVGNWLRQGDGAFLALSDTLGAVSTTGGTSAVPAAAALSRAIEVTGALASNAVLTLPFAQAGLLYALYNGTSGGFSLTVNGPGNAGFAIAQAKRAVGYINASGALVRVTPDT